MALIVPLVVGGGLAVLLALIWQSDPGPDPFAPTNAGNKAAISAPDFTKDWEYFTADEMIRTGTGLANEPDMNAWQNLDLLVTVALDPIRRRLGLPVVVTSGYRSEAVNGAVGGESGSHHMSGYAADIAVAGTDPLSLLNLIRSMGLPLNEVIAYEQTGQVHVSAKPTTRSTEWFLDRQDGSALVLL